MPPLTVTAPNAPASVLLLPNEPKLRLAPGATEKFIPGLTGVPGASVSVPALALVKVVPPEMVPENAVVPVSVTVSVADPPRTRAPAPARSPVAALAVPKFMVAPDATVRAPVVRVGDEPV